MRPRGRGDDVDEEEEEEAVDYSPHRSELEPEPEPEPESETDADADADAALQPPPPPPARAPLSSLVVKPSREGRRLLLLPGCRRGSARSSRPRRRCAGRHRGPRSPPTARPLAAGEGEAPLAPAAAAG